MRSFAARSSGSTSARDQPSRPPPRARRSRAGCPRSRRSRCGSSSRRSCRRAGTRRAGRGSRRRSRSRAGTTRRARWRRARRAASRRRVRAEVGPALEHEDRLVRALGEQAGERGAGRAAADDERVDVPGQFLHPRKTSGPGRSSCRLRESGPRPISGIQLGLSRRWRSPSTRRAGANCARDVRWPAASSAATAGRSSCSTPPTRAASTASATGSRAATRRRPRSSRRRSCAALATLPDERAGRARHPRPPLGDRARPRLRAAYERRRALARPDSAASTRSEVGAANQRLSPRQRMTLALRDLEGRPDDEIALALGADAATVAALVARARLRLREELRAARRRRRAAATACPRSRPTSTARCRPSAARELETHVADCAGCRAALFALQEAALRYRSLPVPVPPGELRSRITVALGAVGFPTRRPRALVPDPAPGAAGRPMAAAAAMAALVVRRRGRHDRRLAQRRTGSQRAHPRAGLASPAIARRRNAALPLGRRSGTPLHPRRRRPRPARRPPRRRRRSSAICAPARRGPRARDRGRARPARAARRPPRSQRAAPPPPRRRRRLRRRRARSPAPPRSRRSKAQAIPVQILPPVAPPHTPATADAPPPPPEPPPPADPAGPAQTTST